MPRPKQRTPELRDRVLRVAIATLASVGAAGFTTRKVAESANTSTPAVYELFGDKAGLVREIFFDGFRSLRSAFDALGQTEDARADVVVMVRTFRAFVLTNPALAQVMFSRPFTDFDPGPAERKAGDAVRRFIVDRVRACIDEGVIEEPASETDIAHVILSLAHGLAATEAAGWLGTSKASIERRWELAVNALLDGLSA